MRPPQPQSRPMPHPVLLRLHQELLQIDEIYAQNSRKIQVLREDHQEMVGTYAAVKEDLSRAHLQLRQLSDTARKVREERDFEIKKVYDRSLAVESQFREIEAVKSERDEVVSYLRNLTEAKIQLAAEFRAVDSELNRVKMDANDVADIKDDLGSMGLELLKGRAAVEFEKKTRAANLEQYKAMESKTVSMKNEIERLRDELAHAEKRARAAAAAAAASNSDHGYLPNYGGPEMVFQGGHSTHYPTHQAAGPPDGTSPHLYRPPTGDYSTCIRIMHHKDEASLMHMQSCKLA